MSQYRDPLAGLRSQVATKRAALESRERELTPILRALLHEPLRATMEELRPRALAAAESMQELSDAEAALDGLLAAHDQAAEQAPRLRESADAVPDPAQSKMEPPWLIEERYLLGLRDHVRDRCARIDADAPLSRFGDFAYVARMHFGSAPYTFVITSTLMETSSMQMPYTVYLRTSVPPSLPALVVRRQGAHHAVGKALHLVHDIEIGAPLFDGLFWITGSELAAAVLTPQVRAALEYLQDRSLTLQIGGGIATFSYHGIWGDSQTDVLPDAALDVLVALRTAIETC